MLSLIVTHSRNRVIGFNSELPWLLNEVGITNEVIDKYGDEEMFCVLALAFTEGLADYYESGKLFYRGLTKEELINDIQVILDSPLTDFDELHEAIQDVLNKA